MSDTATKPSATRTSGRLRITEVLRPHWKALTIAMIAVLGETVADVLNPWPIKIVIDNLAKETIKKPHWLGPLITHLFGNNSLAI